MNKLLGSRIDEAYGWIDVSSHKGVSVGEDLISVCTTISYRVCSTLRGNNLEGGTKLVNSNALLGKTTYVNVIVSRLSERGRHMYHPLLAAT